MKDWLIDWYKKYRMECSLCWISRLKTNDFLINFSSFKDWSLIRLLFLLLQMTRLSQRCRDLKWPALGPLRSCNVLLAEESSFFDGQSFNEGPLLRLLFTHLNNLLTQVQYSTVQYSYVRWFMQNCHDKNCESMTMAWKWGSFEMKKRKKGSKLRETKIWP